MFLFRNNSNQTQHNQLINQTIYSQSDGDLMQLRSSFEVLERSKIESLRIQVFFTELAVSVELSLAIFRAFLYKPLPMCFHVTRATRHKLFEAIDETRRDRV